MPEKPKPEGKKEIVTMTVSDMAEYISKALDIVAKINELKTAAQTKQDYQELTKLYQQLEKIYEGKEGQELEPWLAQQYEEEKAKGKKDFSTALAELMEDLVENPDKY